MLTETPYLAMALNNAWANRTLYAAVSHLDADAFSAPAPGFFNSLARTLNHIYEVDLYYLDALKAGGKGRAVFQRDDILSPVALCGLQAEVDADLAAFCADLTPEVLQETRETERQDGITHERVDALLLHLCQHQIHHRGQAHTQVHSLGIDPPQLDDFYLEFGRAETAKPYWSPGL